MTQPTAPDHVAHSQGEMERGHVAVKCGRCDGKGAIASFSVRFSGKCFACNGAGSLWMTRAAYDKKQRRIAEHDAYFAAQLAANPICRACGYAVSGPDSWDGTSCKCSQRTQSQAVRPVRVTDPSKFEEAMKDALTPVVYIAPRPDLSRAIERREQAREMLR